MKTKLMLALLLCTAAVGSASADGIGIDPNGGRGHLTASADHRCTIDPNGGVCVGTSLAGDRGAGLDPDGKP
jgi:hypothetical protein